MVLQQSRTPYAHHTMPMHTQDREHVHAEEQRRTLQQQAQQRAELSQYEDGLARKRSESEHEKQRQRNAELVMLQVGDWA